MGCGLFPQGKSRPRMEDMMDTDSREKILRMAAAVLEYRNRSAKALYDRLLEKGAEERDAAWAVARLQELGYLNDAEYGRLLVRDLCRRGYGPGRIRRYLKEKKLDGPDIELAMEEYVFQPEKLREYIDSRLRGRTGDRRELKRAADGLFRRGFGWDEIQSALREYALQMEEEL